MKNTTRLLSFLLSPLLFAAQGTTFEIITKENVALTNNAIVHQSTASHNTSEHELFIHNISATSQTLTIYKNDEVMNQVSSSDRSEAYFCTGVTCYDPLTLSAPLVIGPGEKISFKSYLHEASAVGESKVRYLFANGKEEMNVVYMYNNIAGINDNHLTDHRLGYPFPNPATDKVSFTFDNQDQHAAFNIQILSATGAIVQNHKMPLQSGNNMFTINLQNLPAGFYFLQVRGEDYSQMRKVYITN